MNEEQMQSFVSAVELGTLSAAAKDRYLSVPSLSYRIGTLEDEVGCKLLARTARGVSTTPAGQTMYRACKEALALLGTGKTQARELAREGAETADAARIRLGIWWQAPGYLIHAMHVLTQRHGIKADFIETDCNHAVDDLAKGKFDLFISRRSRRFEREGFTFTPFRTTRYLCGISPTSPLTRHGVITMDLLKGRVVYAGGDYRDFVELDGYVDDFARDDVVKESIFTQQLIMECMRDTAVTFFSPEFIDKFCPPLEYRPMDWPCISVGMYATSDVQASWPAQAVIEACRQEPTSTE